MTNPYDVVRQFEDALCEYTGSKYAVAVNSCTSALLICCAYHKVDWVQIPRRTYVSVGMAIKVAGGKVAFRDEDWSGMYLLHPYPIWDSARRFTSGMYIEGEFMCCSFHWSKHLQIGLGGCILHDSDEADPILRRMRFDGRTEGVEPKDDEFPVLGYHAYLTPGLAADGLMRMSLLPKHNADLENSDYPDLSQVGLFQ